MTEIGTFRGFVSRGDPSAWDKQVADFTTDGTEKILDLSSIIPSNAKAALLYILLNDDASASYLIFTPYENLNNLNRSLIYTQAANVSITQEFIMPLGASRKLKYTGSNLSFTSILFTVKGWWF